MSRPRSTSFKVDSKPEFEAWIKKVHQEEMKPSLWFSPNPYKRVIEKAWVEWTFVWCAIMGVVMVTGLGAEWEDQGLMALGVGLMIGTYMWPLLGSGRGSSTSPLRGIQAPKSSNRKFLSTLNAMFGGVCALSFTMHYIATPFFFDVLHMKYGFKVTIRIDRNPVFLYFVTVAYFATYQVFSCMLVRRASYLFYHEPSGNSKGHQGKSLYNFYGLSIRIVLYSLIPFAVAFGETVSNANPFIADLFCYNNIRWVLTFGTFSYGIGFVFSIPVWMWGVSEKPLRPTYEEFQQEEKRKGRGSTRKQIWMSIVGSALVSILHGVCLMYLRSEVAPQYTTVVPDADPTGGCLADTQRPMREWLEVLRAVGLPV